MPRQAKGARLYERKRAGRASAWVILDTGGIEIATGAGSRREAESALADYISRRARPTGPAAPEDMTVGQALTIYAEQHAATVAAPERIGYAIDALVPFWGSVKVAAVKGETCRRYAAWRSVAPGTARRELGTLQAALNHCAREGYLTSAPTVTLPAKPPAKQRWLTRAEAYWLLRAARRLRIDGRHLAWFLVLSLKTGTRKDRALSIEISAGPTLRHGRIDPVHGVLYRRGDGEAETAKRAAPARLPRSLLAHARRKARLGHRWFVQDHQGRRIGDIKKGFARAKVLAMEMAAAVGQPVDLGDVTPHTLKHTAITWALQNGASVWDAAGYFSTTADTIERTYGHHSPAHQSSAIRAVERRGRE